MMQSLEIDDEDSVGVVVDLEKVFDLKISDDEAAGMRSVGDIFDFLRARFATAEPGRGCFTALAFYRLRRAIRDIAGIDAALSPSTDVSVFPNRNARLFAREIETHTGLGFPNLSATWIGKIGACCWVLAACALLFSGPLASVTGFPVFAWWVAALGFFITGQLLWHGDPRRLPPEYRTIGDLARKIALLNYGKLNKLGARARDDDIWLSMSEVLSKYTPMPCAQFTRDTLLLQSAKNAP